MVRRNMRHGIGRVQFGVQSVKSLSRLLTLTAVTLVLGMIASPVQAINVSGNLSGGTWRAADSPVRVLDDILLSSEDTLYIEPGVRIEFTGPFVFEVRGMLVASGTKLDMITFTMESGIDDSLRWGGIRFIQAQNGCLLHFVRVEKAWARGVWPLNCGGGIYAESCNPFISRSEIVGNHADADGGGIYGWFSNTNLRNVLVYGNSAANYGGGMYFSYSSPQIINCTVVLDTAGAWGGGIFAGAESKPVICNSIVNNNVHNLWDGQLPPGDGFTKDFGRAQSADPSVSFSNVGVIALTPYPGSGNIYLDPGFVSITPPYDFHLKYSSANVDGGDPAYSAALEPDILINRIDVGAYGGTEEATPSVPVISVNFNTLNYGNYRLNASTQKEIKIQNLGHYRLFIDSFRFSSRAFYPDSTEGDHGMIPSYLAAPIEPGEQAKFTIYFKPNDIRAYSETLTIVSNDTIFANPVVALNGTGIDPVASLSDSLFFPRTALGSRTTRSLFVKNTGRSNLTIEENGVQGEGFDTQVLDESVAPGDSAEIRITFAPVLPESYEASAGFDSNDRGLFIYLLGRGYGPKLVLPDTSARFLGYVYFNGDTAVSQVEIVNTGDEDLVISSAVVNDPVAFSTVIPVGGFRIPADSTGFLTVKFHPPQANEIRSAVLTINSNYPIPQTLSLSGRGMAEPGRYVFGHVSGTWEWSVGHPDYIVLDSVYIPANERLKIEPGARILFEPGAAFMADGEVRAIGTPNDSIKFLPRDPSGTASARWKGISLAIEDESRFSFCVVKSSRNGISIKGASPRIEYSTIIDNADSAAIDSGASLGGAIRLETSGAVISGCVIRGNNASLGGAIYAVNSKPTVTNCRITDNAADDGSAIYLKFLTGGLYQSLVIDNNIAPFGNGAFTSVDRSAPRIINCTIADNNGVGIRALDRSLPTVINSIVWGNSAGFELINGSNALITYTDYPGGLAGNRNVDVDPAFIVSRATPYMLADNSPLIDIGNPESSYRDYFFPPSKMTSRNDLGAYGGPLGGSWGIPSMAISLFQNPAFPRWCDVIVSAETVFDAAPVCSVEFNEGTMIPVALLPIDGQSYRGSIESPVDGTIFLTANGMVNGLAQKVGRTFEIVLIDNISRTLALDDLGGSLIIPEGSGSEGSMVIARSGQTSVKPDPDFLPLTNSIIIAGLHSDAVVEVPTSFYRMTGRVNNLALFYNTLSGWQRVAGNLDNETLKSRIPGDGEYVLAISEIEAVVELPPAEPGLIEAFPNPFNGGVSIAFYLNSTSNVSLTIHDLAGRELATILNERMEPGRHQRHWNAENRLGNSLPSGVYWARLETDGGVSSTKLLLVR